MSRSTTTSLLPLVLVALLLFSAATYPAFYLLAGNYHPSPTGKPCVRNFRYRWQATMFIPAAQVESLVRNQIIALGWYDPLQGIGGVL